MIASRTVYTCGLRVVKFERDLKTRSKSEITQKERSDIAVSFHSSNAINMKRMERFTFKATNSLFICQCPRIVAKCFWIFFNMLKCIGSP